MKDFRFQNVPKYVEFLGHHSETPLIRFFFHLLLGDWMAFLVHNSSGPQYFIYIYIGMRTSI